MVLKSATPLRIGDIQRKLGLSTPSLAQYHVKKLLELGLLREESAGFVSAKNVLETIGFEGLLIPYEAGYAVFFAVTLVSMLLILYLSRNIAITTFVFVAILSNALALAIFIYETARRLNSLD